MPRFTKTETKIMNVLADGMPHLKCELKETFDPLAEDKVLIVHVANIRKKLKPVGHTIACVYRNRRVQYQLFRFISVS